MDETQKLEFLPIIRQWGGAATDAVLDPKCHIFTHPPLQGIIGYRLDSKAVVVLGDPICPPEELKPLVQAFHQFCKENGYALVCLMASQSFAELCLEMYGAATIQVGHQVMTNPQKGAFDRTGTKASLVRRKVRHAIKDGVEVFEYTGHDPTLENALEAATQEWLDGRTGPQIHISNPYTFSNREGKRWFYATQQGKVCGVLIASRLESAQGWLCNHLMPTPTAPSGTPEILVVKALEKFASEGCQQIVFGIYPAKQIGNIHGLNRLASWLIKTIFFIHRKIFHLDGHMGFWEKFEPDLEPTYVSIIDRRHPVRILKSLNSALNVSL